MQRDQRYRQRQISSNNSTSRSSLSSTRQKIYRAATWSGNNYKVKDDDEEEDDDDEYHIDLQQDRRFPGSPTAVNMVYQYVFEEGLELTLIPENEATPFTAGYKVLELGLTGFTGRLIVTQQAIRQYANPGYILQREEKKDDSVITSSSSSSSESEGRRPRYAESKRFATKRRVHDATAPHKNTRIPTDPQPTRATHGRSASAESPQFVGVDDGVEVVSVASSVSTRSAKRTDKEDAILQLASIFAAPHPIKKPNESEVIDEESMYSQGFHDQRIMGNPESVGGGSGEQPPDLLTEFAHAFAVLDAAPGPRNENGSIDEDTSLAAASMATSAAESSSAGVNATTQGDVLSDFTAAFAALSGPSSSPPDAQGGSIDDDKTNAASFSSMGTSHRSDRSAMDEPSPASGRMDRVEEFTTVFAALSCPPNVPEMVLGSIDEGSGVTSIRSASDVSQSVSNESGKTPEKPPKGHSAQDTLSEYVAAFGELTGPSEAPKPSKGEMIDDESRPSLSGSSSLSFSAASESHQRSKPDTVQIAEDPLDPMTDFVHAFGALSGPPSRQQNQGQMIDEESRSTGLSSSAPRSSVSLSSSEDPLTQFTKVYSAESAVPTSVHQPRRSINSASEKVSPETKATRRTSQKSNGRKAIAGVVGGKPKISLAKKKKIREMFPNYPDVSTGSHGTLDPVGVYLHQKCSSPFEKTLGPKDLAELLEVFPFAAYCADDKGRLPVHVLGENGQLVKDPQGRQRATDLAKLLIHAYPQSVTYPDSNGRLPFVALLQEWIDAHYDQMSRFGKDSKHSVGPKWRLSTTGRTGSALEDKPIQYDKLFPNMELWPSAEWCLSMLSMVLDDMIGRGILQEAIARKALEAQMEARRQYVDKVYVSVPYLLKSVLFLDGGVGSARKRILQTSFIRRGLLSRKSVGPWLEAMVLKQGLPSKLAIDYFHLLSHTTPADYIGPKRAPDAADVDAFHREREEVYEAIANMEVIIPALVVLEEKETERAATTNVVWFIMNRSLSQPFAVGLLLIDFILHLTLMMSFRNDVNLDVQDDTFLARTPPNLVPTICVHYIIRKACEALSFLLISNRAFWEYFVSIWNIFDTLTHILTLVADSLRKEHPDTYESVLNAIVLALLWIKVLGFLKFVNKEMATFIMALIQIIVDIRFFMVVFFVVIFMFADMIHVIITTQDQAVCNAADLSDAAEDFCSAWALDYYYRMYAVLLGDFDLTEYTDNKAISFIFFIFTIMGVIILLNVLIAVISDSYAHSKLSSRRLFGRARLGFVAQLIALESFLRPGRNPLKVIQTKLHGSVLGKSQVLTTWKYTACIIRWVVVFSLLGSALTAGVFLLSEVAGHRQSPLYFFLYVFFALVLLIGIWVVCLFVFGDFFRRIGRGFLRPCVRASDYWASAFAFVVSVKLLGFRSAESSRDTSLMFENEESFEDVAEEGSEERKKLMEKLCIMEESMRQAIRETKSQLTKRMDATEERLIHEERKERVQLMKQLSTILARLDSDDYSKFLAEKEAMGMLTSSDGALLASFSVATKDCSSHQSTTRTSNTM